MLIQEDSDLKKVGLELMFLTPEKCSRKDGISAVELAKQWRTDRTMSKLEALLLVANSEKILLISGSGDVIEPESDILAIGSGGNYAYAAALAYMESSDFSAKEHGSVSGRTQIGEGNKSAFRPVCFDMVAVCGHFIHGNGQCFRGSVGLHHGDDLGHSAAAVSVVGGERGTRTIPAPGKDPLVRGHIGKSSRMLDFGVINARFGAFQIVSPRAVRITIGINVRIRTK